MNIPKKLEVPFFEIEKKYPDWMRQIRLSVQQLICNQNELIDYLQAKEEATIIPVGCFCTKKHSTGEASKGGCQHGDTSIDKCEDCGKKRNPPEHEEELIGAIARGWCHTSTSSKVMDTELAEAIGDEVRHHINKFYVSKEKIKREIKRVLNKDNGDYDLSDQLFDSLGLGD